MLGIRFLLASFLLAPALLFADNATYQTALVTPPAPLREFRGAWITSVATNADWPSRRGMSVAEQQAELVALLDHAAQLKFNAVIFQVRPASDAMYASSLEPWSEYLTGTMGQAPQPFYDPLAFAIQEAHRRGLELHAWFNPFRALHPLSRSPVAANHIARTHPEFIRRYDEQLWLDPGEPAVREHVLRVIMDVVGRYDVDGVQFDDYFYPYPKKNALGRELDFPDDATWRRYGLPAGLSRDDWRRANINQFVQGVHQAIQAAKPWVKFGISPFGIWRPQNPPSIRGLDAYAKIYADSRLWLASGWVDYLAPQLYWPIAESEHSFPVLLQWWTRQNVKGRHLWAGLADTATGGKFSSDEIARQIQSVRAQPGAGGEIHYHLRTVIQSHGLATAVGNAYAQPALIPASPWLDSAPPGKPKLAVIAGKSTGIQAQWESAGGKPARWWLFQFQMHGVWVTDILPGNLTSRYFNSFYPDIVSLRAVDRVGNLSVPVVLAVAQRPPARVAPQIGSPTRPPIGPYVPPRLRNGVKR